MGTKAITLREFFTAMENNDLPKVKGQLVQRDLSGAITGGCAYGQAALHLGAKPRSVEKAVLEFGEAKKIPALRDVMNTNDDTDSTIKAIARYYRSQVPWQYLDSPIYVETVGE